MSVEQLFISHYGVEPASVEPLSAAGSNRRYCRLAHPDGHTVIGAEGTSAHENHAFIVMARHFERQALNTPRIVAVSHDEMTYLQQDLGATSLYDAVKPAIGHWQDNSNSKHIDMLRKALTLLPHFQLKAHQGMDYTVCHPVSEMNRRSIMWDLNYFKYCYLKLTGQEFDENALEDDFELLTADLLTRRRMMKFMYRDFQSRNIMLTPQGPMFIDFQGGRRGPLLYDAVSFLWQARLQLPDTTRMALFDDYLAALQNEAPNIDTATLRKDLPYWVLFRMLQVLGAYGFRGLHEQKPQFLDSISQALNSLRQLPLLQNYRTIHRCADGQ